MMIRNLLQNRLNHWLEKRIPPTQSRVLNQKNLFIMPTQAGYWFLVVAFLIFLVAINYQNSPAYGTSFFMVGLFLVTMIHSWRNLAGLKLTRQHAQPTYAGEAAVFKVSLTTTQPRNAYNLKLCWPENTVTEVGTVHSLMQAEVYYSTSKRGWLKPGRMHISSTFPLGLFRTWSWVDLEQQTLVYPSPIKLSHTQPPVSSYGEGHRRFNAQEGDEFAGLKEATITSPRTHISWKAFSRTGELFTKQFEDSSSNTVWLDYRSVTGAGSEQKLSTLCALALICHNNHLEYGLWLPENNIPPAKGQKHLHHCLKALALFGYSEQGGL